MNISYETHTKAIVSTQHNMALELLPSRVTNRSTWHRRLRRLAEVLLCLPLLLACLMLIPLIWLFNQIFSPGPLFYSQERVGMNGQIFSMLKFRSMVVDAESNGAVWAEEDDPRMTVVGRFMRRRHLDEVPQVWNVLKGEMSLIGPRPERPEFVTQLEKELPNYEIRHQIRPGLTGWAQVNYQYGASVQGARIKLEYDLYYVEYQSGWLDLWILIKTIRAVLHLNGR